jgi:hypothetical protein
MSMKNFEIIGKIGGKRKRNRYDARKRIAVICPRVEVFKNYITRILRDRGIHYKYSSCSNFVEIDNYSFHYVSNIRDFRGKRFHDIVHTVPFFEKLIELTEIIRNFHLTEYIPPPQYCAFCKRINGNKRKNTTIQDELRGVSYETGDVTKVTKRVINSVCKHYSDEVDICQSCALSFVINEARYVLVELEFDMHNQFKKKIFRFARKNELITRHFKLYELSPNAPAQTDKDDFYKSSDEAV